MIALDEAGDSFKNSFAEVISNNIERLPKWIGFVITSRPDSSILSPFQKYKPNLINTETESNLSDIKFYLKSKLEKYLPKIPNEEEIISQIINNSEGSFLYISQFCEDVENGSILIDQPNNFPKGLGGTYYNWFQHQFPNIEEYQKRIRPILRAVLSAYEPLSVSYLQKLFDLEEEVANDSINELGSLFIMTNDFKIKPYHKYLYDWLIDKEKSGVFYVSISEGHKVIANFGWHDYENDFISSNYYNLLYTPFHLYSSSEYNKLFKILHDENYLKKLTELYGIEYLEHLPDVVRKWSFGNKLTKPKGAYQTALAILQAPGDWYTITEFFYGGCDWRCEKCNWTNGQSSLPNTKFCPNCGWETNEAEKIAWKRITKETNREN